MRSGTTCAAGSTQSNDFFESLRAAVEYLCAEAADGHGARMMTVGLHERWSGQASRASAIRDFVEYAAARPDVRFMRRADIARWWLAHHHEWDPAPGRSGQPQVHASPADDRKDHLKRGLRAGPPARRGQGHPLGLLSSALPGLDPARTCELAAGAGLAGLEWVTGGGRADALPAATPAAMAARLGRLTVSHGLAVRGLAVRGAAGRGPAGDWALPGAGRGDGRTAAAGDRAAVLGRRPGRGAEPPGWPTRRSRRPGARRRRPAAGRAGARHAGPRPRVVPPHRRDPPAGPRRRRLRPGRHAGRGPRRGRARGRRARPLPAARRRPGHGPPAGRANLGLGQGRPARASYAGPMCSRRWPRQATAAG